MAYKPCATEMEFIHIDGIPFPKVWVEMGDGSGRMIDQQVFSKVRGGGPVELEPYIRRDSKGRYWTPASALEENPPPKSKFAANPGPTSRYSDARGEGEEDETGTPSAKHIKLENRFRPSNFADKFKDLKAAALDLKGALSKPRPASKIIQLLRNLADKLGSKPMMFSMHEFKIVHLIMCQTLRCLGLHKTLVQALEAGVLDTSNPELRQLLLDLQHELLHVARETETVDDDQGVPHAVPSDRFESLREHPQMVALARAASQKQSDHPPRPAAGTSRGNTSSNTSSSSSVTAGPDASAGKEEPLCERVCGHCGKTPPHVALKLCSGCRQRWFCSSACQKQAWPAHKADCKKAAAQGRPG